VRPLALVLSVIQDLKTRVLARMVLEGAGHRVVDTTSSAQAISLLENGLNPDCLLCEGSYADSSKADAFLPFLRWVSADSVCLITKLSEQELRSSAALHGIQHFLSDPVTRFDLESLIDRMSQIEPHAGTAASPVDLIFNQKPVAVDRRLPSTRALPRMLPPPCIEELGGNNFFLAASAKMLEIYRQVKLIADIDVSVLILGESGTGKEVIAQLIHKNSRRSREKFLKVNCAALPADLLESELFGHRQGAFTGALNDRSGKFEQANRGTLLLDEIGELGVQMQAKLLHVLQDGQFARLGAQEVTKVDVRVLAATNVLIDDALFNGAFREDLYYRLSVFTIKIPPLRERREEIPYLVEQIIRRTPNELRNGFGVNLPARLMDVALQYDWRGNLRELRNFITRTIVMRDTDAAARELEAKIEMSGGNDSLGRATAVPPACAGIRSIVRDVKDRTEAEMIRNALEVFSWNRRRAAQYLNLSYRALLYKIKQHRLRPRTSGAPDQAFQGVRSSRQNSF